MFNKSELSTIKKWYKKIKAVDILGGRCNMCGNSDIKDLSFHHLDPNEKEGELNKLLNNSWLTSKEEIKKCILLCHNCHAEHHHNETNENSIYLSCRITKNTFLEYKGGICKKCGYNKCQAALSFHHRNGDEKLFKVSKTTKVFRSIVDITKEFIDELDKCDLLCINCHNKEHIRHDLYEYAIKNYSSYKMREISKKYNTDIIEDLFFKQNKSQKEITEIIGIKKSTLCGIIKKLNEEKKAS